MTNQERAQVLKMVEEGKLTPEQGLRLMQTLEQNPAEEEQAASRPETAPAPAAPEPAEEPQAEPDSIIKKLAEKGRQLWIIPLWIGIGMTVLSAFGMYLVMRSAGTNFWFYCLGLPLLLGVAVMVLGAASRTARWIFVKVEEAPHGDQKPFRLTLGFPLPLRLTAWIFRHFGHYIPNLDQAVTGEALDALERTTSMDTPLVVNVDEGRDGDKVQVYIG